MKNIIFITGTDTGVGKTVITGLLGKGLKNKGFKVLTQKWVETGNTEKSYDLEYHAAAIGENLDEKLAHLQNPYLFSLPSSPHLAAKTDNEEIDIDRLTESSKQLSEQCDFLLIEGAGGLLVPLNTNMLTVDVVKKTEAKVIIVADNKLGVVNHTLLTVEALKIRGIDILGIIFNRTGKDTELPDFALKDNIEIIKTFSKEKVLGEIQDINDNFVAVTDKIAEEFYE